MRRRLCPFLCLVLAAPLGGCNCSEGPLTKVQPPPEKTHLDAGFIFPDAAPPDSGVPDVPPDAGIEARVLTFNGTQPVLVYFNASKDLSFTLATASGVPVPSTNVVFMFAGTGGRLSGTSALTDASGVAVIRFSAGATPGQGTLVASAELANTVAVSIVVVEDPNTRLVLDVRSGARVPVTTADAMVYVGTPSMLPTCAHLLGGAPPPPPSFSAMFSSLPGSSAFDRQHSGMSVTAFAQGRNASGALVAKGCTEGVRLAGGVDTHVLVTLDQLPPNLDGNYDVLLAIDVGQTIPPPAGPTIVLITDLLSDPAGWLTYQLLGVADDNFGTTFVEWGSPPMRASFDDVEANPTMFGAWKSARDTFDGILRMQLGQPYIDLTTIGGDLAHLVRGFEVGAGYTVTATGAQGRVNVQEAWQAMVFEWRHGCPTGDLGCARHEIDLSGANMQLVPATATYGATVRYTPSAQESERYTLDLDPHHIDIRYGAIIILLLDQLVFPNLPPPLTGNNLTDVLNHLIDCSSIANSLSMSTGIPAPFFQGICMSAVSSAAMAIENQILMLDSGSNGLVVGSGSNGGHMVLVDRDLDLSTEIVESFTTPLSWSNGQATSGNPITGAGRRRATHCRRDAECPSPTVCTAIPSYLKVRALENDCRARVGMLAGAATCTHDADCATGLCIDAGMGRHVCFEACAGATACAVGTCTANAASVSLDPVLMGLGTAHADACLP